MLPLAALRVGEITLDGRIAFHHFVPIGPQRYQKCGPVIVAVLVRDAIPQATLDRRPLAVQRHDFEVGVIRHTVGLLGTLKAAAHLLGVDEATLYRKLRGLRGGAAVAGEEIGADLCG